MNACFIDKGWRLDHRCVLLLKQPSAATSRPERKKERRNSLDEGFGISFLIAKIQHVLCLPPAPSLRCFLGTSCRILQAVLECVHVWVGPQSVEDVDVLMGKGGREIWNMSCDDDAARTKSEIFLTTSKRGRRRMIRLAILSSFLSMVCCASVQTHVPDKQLVQLTLDLYLQGRSLVPTKTDLLQVDKWPPRMQSCGAALNIKPDPMCTEGIQPIKSSACCPSYCRRCDCMSIRPAVCCPMAVKYSGRLCSSVGAPCMRNNLYLRLHLARGGVSNTPGNLWDNPVDTIDGTLSDAWREAELELKRAMFSNNTELDSKRELIQKHKFNSDDVTFVQQKDALLIVSVAGKWDDLASGKLAAAVESWVKDSRGFAYAIFFVGNKVPGPPGPSVLLQVENWRVVRLSTEEEYPPLSLHREMLRYLYNTQHMRNKHVLYLFVDMDTYVNANILRRTVPLLLPASTPLYQGLAAQGRREERGELSLKSKYCTGGAGWFGNSNLLRVIGPFLDELRVKGRRGHSDVEIGRLIHNITGQGCMDPHFEMMELFTGTNYDGVTSKVMLNRKKQIEGSLHVTPPLRYYKAITVHPIKSVKQYLRFHHKVRGYLMGVHIPPCAGHNFKYFLSERRDFVKSCTHNPGLQMFMTGAQLPECPPPLDVPPGSTRSSLFKNMYIISVQENRKNMKWLQNWGKRMNSTVTEVSHGGGMFNRLENFLHISSRDQLRPQLYMEIFQDALKRGLQRIAILEDAVNVEQNFSELISMLCDDPRCVAHLHTKYKGGVLLLSSCGTLADGTYPSWKVSLDPSNRSNWFDGTKLREDEVKLYSTALGRSLCYNIGMQGGCMRAGIYHRQVFEHVIDWIQTNGNTNLDSVLPYLAYHGYPVRVAYPALFYKH